MLLKGNPEPSSTPPCSSHPGSSPGLMGASGITPWTSSAPQLINNSINKQSISPPCVQAAAQSISSPPPNQARSSFQAPKKSTYYQFKGDETSLASDAGVQHHSQQLHPIHGAPGSPPGLGEGSRAALAPSLAPSLAWIPIWFP